MDGNVSVIKDIVAIILMSIGAVSCAVLVGGLAWLLPSLFRSARNIESITRSAVELTPDIVAAGKNVKGGGKLGRWGGVKLYHSA